RIDKMSYMKAINEIKKGDFKNTYLLTGTESYFIEQFKKELIKSLGTKVESEIHEYDLTETSIQEVITRSEEHTSELQLRFDLVCRLLLEKKKNTHEQNSDKLITI